MNTVERDKLLHSVSNRALLSELLDRTPNLVSRFAPDVSFDHEAQSSPDRELESFASFERDDGSTVPLLDGYRNSIKDGWRNFFWPTRTLRSLGARGRLDAEGERLVRELETARTLPFPLEDLLPVLERTESRHPGELVRDDTVDPKLGEPVLAVEPTRDHVVQTARSSLRSARKIMNLAPDLGIDVSDARILEVGSGRGYLTMALATWEPEAALGIDLDPGPYHSVAERPALRSWFLDEGTEAYRGLWTADAETLPFADDSFDIVHSASVLEHVRDPEQAIREMARVLAPGGLAINGIDPWFSPRGGHSLCTLDFPWGHVRLSTDEMLRYLREQRPHEAEHAEEFYEHAFPDEPLTLRDHLDAFLTSSFEIVEWETASALPDHLRMLDPDAWAEIQDRFPTVSPEDLLVSHLQVVARQPPDGNGPAGPG